MLRKVTRKLAALLVVFVTTVGMLLTGLQSVKAADDGTYSVDIRTVEYNTKNENGVYQDLYEIIDPVVKIPSDKHLIYMTINVRNGYFNTEAISDTATDAEGNKYGVHHYNGEGSNKGAYSDLIILSDAYKSASKIEELLKKIKFYYAYDYDGVASPGVRLKGVQLSGSTKSSRPEKQVHLKCIYVE